MSSVLIEDHIKAGDLAAALKTLQGQIRENGADARLRLSLCQFLCVMGQWERAHGQLDVIASLGDEHTAWVNMIASLLLGESLRRSVFAGKATPLVLGEPTDWVAKLIHALPTAGASAQAALRSGAFEGAPSLGARVNGNEVPWLADADSRLGPVLDAIMEGKYYWIPFARIARLSIEIPSDLRHLVWIPAQATWTTGGQSALHIPCRYSETENCADDKLRLARKTIWEALSDNQYRGLGQRMFTAGELDFALLEVRTIEFIHPEGIPTLGMAEEVAEAPLADSV